MFYLLRTLDPDTETRSYARIAHYDRVKQRPNYHLLPNNAVSKVLFDTSGAKPKAIGVEFITVATGVVNQAFASKEVILSAGSVHSPQILQLSGVGPKALLENLGIEVLVDLPGVGANFHDTYVFNINYNCKTSHPSHSLLIYF